MLPCFIERNGPPLMNVDSGSVGTRGEVGWMRGPCACPRWLCVIRRGITYPTESYCEKDKHKAPSFPHIHPLSLQDGPRALLHSVGKIHQDMGDSRGRPDLLPIIPSLCHTAFCITSRTNSPPLTSISTVAPSCTLPSRIASATLFCTSRWMTRLRGRAPNCGS